MHHIIARFVNSEFRIRDSCERADYLSRLETALERTDWRLLAYAIMSSHIHLCAVGGSRPLASLIHSVHTGFGGWLNTRQRRSGHVFAGRPRSILLDDCVTGRLVAYLHNNPVRANVARNAAASTWTSHRAYLGLDTAPPFLRVDLGLHLAGFSDPASFHSYVALRSGEPRDPLLSGDSLTNVRTASRNAADAEAELSDPRLVGDRLEYEIWLRGTTQLRRRIAVSVGAVIDAACQETGARAVTVRSRSRCREAVETRRLALLVWRELGQPQVVMAGALGIRASAASQLLTRNLAAVRQLSEACARIMSEFRRLAA